MTFNAGRSRISISFFFFVTVCIALVLDTTNTAVLTLCAAAVHECGHLICMLAFGECPSKIYIAPFGFCITRFSDSSYRREMLIAFCGPLANLFAALVMLLAMLFCHARGLIKPIAVNIALALFNLLPIEPLDCGRAVRCFLMYKFNCVRAEKTAFIIGIIFLIPLSALGFYVLIKSKYNITLLLASIYLAFMLLKRRE